MSADSKSKTPSGDESGEALLGEEREGAPFKNTTSQGKFTAEQAFPVFTAPRVDSAVWKAKAIGWGEYIDRLRNPVVTDEKTGVGLYVLGAVFKGNRRLRDNLVSRSVITLDADAADPGLPERVMALPWRAAYHTTFSHAPDAPRYRVIVPLGEGVSSEQYSVLASALMDRLGRECFDRGSVDPERCMYWPSTPDVDIYDWGVTDGQLLRPEELVLTDDPFAGLDKPRLPDTASILAGVPVGDRNNFLFRLACRLRRPDQLNEDREAVTAVILTAAANAGFSEKEALQCVDQAFRQEHGDTDAGDLESRIAAEAERQVIRLKAIERAKALLAAEKREALPSLVSLADFLDVPDEDVLYRIEDLFPVGGHGIIAAQYKAGKTTLLGNLIRSLVDGDPFLGRYHVEPVQSLVLIDDELDERVLRRWLRDQGIRNANAVRLVSLRGRLSSFNILDESVRAAWADAVRGSDLLLLDCLRPVLDALGLDESHDAGRFLLAFDELLGSAGISEGQIVHHMGHANERSRGDSRLQDWPEFTWKLVRESDDPSSRRYFSAYGRDVDVKETELHYDAETRRLTLGSGSRKDSKIDEVVEAIVVLLTERGDLDGKGIEDAMENSPFGRADVRAAIQKARNTGRTRSYPGKGNSKMNTVQP
ncbi:AAA family ATPase [Pseudarthrobacter sp. NPDC058119]|uniref:AAA family ATPase n=1 Tax=Pseudarthrobacter sp. NPDC058119 TaxID=3346348 RepID=UPI0036DC5EA3